MQHPVGYEVAENGRITLVDFSALFSNPWLFWEYPHNMTATVVTASFVMAGIGAYYLLSRKFVELGKVFLKVGVIAGFCSTLIVAYPTGDQQAAHVAKYQPSTLASMEGLFQTEKGAPIAMIGQPNMEEKRLDNPIVIPHMLSLLTYKRFDAEVKGMNAYPEDELPTNIPLLYYSFHIMVGLGTLFIGLMTLALFYLWRKKLFEKRWVLWMLMVAVPFPYIATNSRLDDCRTR